MRVLGFSKLWLQLAQPTFTTFRYPRRDKDWCAGEQIQIVFDKRGSDHSILGIAEIVKVNPRCLAMHKCNCGYRKISDGEAKIDGFKSKYAMWHWWEETYKDTDRWPDYHPNRISLVWQQMWLYVPEQKEEIAKKWADMLDEHGKGTKYLVRQDVLEHIHGGGI